MSGLDATFAALADPTRRAVIELLRGGPLCAGDLSSALEMSAPAMSRHLRMLRQSGLIEEERAEHDARVHLLHLRPERFGELRSWVQDVEQFWTGQLAAFKRHVERRKTRGRA